MADKAPKKVPHPNWLAATAKHRFKPGQSGNAKGCPQSLEPFRWKPGESGNPKGRPKTKRVSEAIRGRFEELAPNDPLGRTNAELLSDIYLERAMAGDVRAFIELMDRAEGKPLQAIDLKGNLDVNHQERSARVLERIRELKAARAAQ